jgi:hypothetical protein
LLLTALALTVVATPAEAERQVFFSNGCGKSANEPMEVVLACADAKLRLVDLTWNRWDAHSATATGTMWHPDFDDPSCQRKPAVGCTVYSEVPATVRLWRPVKCPSNGLWQFTRLRAEAPEDPDPTVRETTREYRCSEFPGAKPKHKRRAFLSFGEARWMMEDALSRREVFTFEKAPSKQVSCNRRLQRDRVRCRMRWSLGADIHFHGHGTIWITYERGVQEWNYSYRVKGVNEYCLRVGGSGCRKTWVVR